MSFRSGRVRLLALSAGALGMAMVSQTASAETLQAGIYDLSNHPSGALQPPPYGLRLDELFDVTPGVDSFVFDFDHASSNMVLTYNGSDRIRILGQAFGGRDIGGDFAAEASTGVYTIDFVYDVGVGLVPGDDDLWAQTGSGSNFGSISGPGGTVNLTDMVLNGFTFRFGDETNNNGHRGFDGISGWGWLDFDGHEGAADWIFTAEFNRVPAPGALALLGVGGLIATRRRR